MTWADYGKPISGGPEILGAAELVRRLYYDLRECTGGPLHWMLDDGNIYDDQMPDPQRELKLFEYLWNGDFVRWQQAGDSTGVEHRQAIQDCCRGILYAFKRMNEAERTCVLAWHWGDIERELPDWYVRHQTPEHRAEAAEAANELVRLAVAVPLGVRPEPENKPCVSVPCPPFISHVTGVVHPGPGQVFAPGAKITGPGIVESSVNSDGSATITWERTPAGLDMLDALGDASQLPYRVTDTSSGWCSTAPGVGLVRDALEDPRQIRPVYPDDIEPG